MKTHSEFRAQRGFVILATVFATLVELLVVIAIICVLICEIDPATGKVEKAAAGMAEYRSLAPLATQLLDFSQASASNSRAFRLSLATDAAATRDSGTASAEVTMDSLKFFCDAGTKIADLQKQVNGLLATTGDSSEQRTLLTETKEALDGELPAVQKLGHSLHSKAGSLCPATIP
jgi:competence protein ComGC